MDPVTHAALGIAVAIAAAPKPLALRHAVLVGAAAGLLPDADLLLSSASDPLFTLEYHRHFTHSLVFSPVIALVTSAVVWLVGRRRHAPADFLLLLFPAWLAALSHLFCDAWTSYGTRVWWPLADTRTALDWISVIDPMLTIPLAVGAAWAALSQTRRPAALGLIWVAVYLGLCGVQQDRARSAHNAWLASRNLPAPSRVTIKPSFANILVWRALSLHGDTLQTTAIRCGLGAPTILAGARHPVFAATPEKAITHFGLPPDSTQARDIRRFHRLSEGWIGRHPEKPDLLGDLRYATLPQTIAPLWCIRIQPDQPQSPVAWAPQRSLQSAPWPELWQLIRGRHPGLRPLPDS